MTSTDLVVRRASAVDAGEVAAVFLASRRAAPMPAPVHSEDAIRAWWDDNLRGYDDTWVAENQAGLVIGYARISGDWLSDLYVTPAHAGQGVGSALLDLVKSLRPDGFSLWVFEENRIARDFYAHRDLIELLRTDGSGNDELAPDIQMAWPGKQPLIFLRGLIDDLDEELGAILQRRATLTAAIQGYKPVGGSAGRDTSRERAIAVRLAVHAPALGVDRLQRIIHAVISESLDAAQ